VVKVDNNPTSPLPLSELEKIRLDVLQAEIVAVSESVHDGSATEEFLEAGVEALKQIPFDPVQVLDAVHIPDDAGEHRDGLERILGRIPNGWGRWISCGPGWYPIIVDLADAIAELLPEYEIHQVKEKFGTLRFYWGTPYREPACCDAFRSRDPRPFEGAISGPFAPKDRDPEELRILEEWFVRYQEHLASAEHKHVTNAAAAAVDRKQTKEIVERIELYIDAAEEASAKTCESCGSPGGLYEDHGWLATLCASCSTSSGYVPHR
jgi:hypothetical protein